MFLQSGYARMTRAARVGLALCALWGLQAHGQNSPCTSSAAAAAAKAQAALNKLAGMLGRAPTSTTPCAGNPSPTAAATPATTGSPTAATSTSAGLQPVSSGAPVAPGAAPWSPDAVASPSNPTARPFAGPLKPAELPDIAGLHLGIGLDQATAIVKQTHPGAMTVSVFGPYVRRAQWQSGIPTANDAWEFALTEAPSTPAVYFITRGVAYPNMLSHTSALAGLRAKYGHETLAIAGPGVAAPGNDNNISMMYWLFDEHGKAIPPGPVNDLRPYGCEVLADNNYRSMVGNFHDKRMPPPGMCESVIVIRADVAPQDMGRVLTVTVVDNALMVRSAKASSDYQIQQAEQQHKQQLQQSNEVKPAL